MATRRENSWILAVLAVGLVPLWLASCVPSDSVDQMTGTGGSSATAGTSGTAGDNGTAGTTGAGGTTGRRADRLIPPAPAAADRHGRQWTWHRRQWTGHGRQRTWHGRQRTGHRRQRTGHRR